MKFYIRLVIATLCVVAASASAHAEALPIRAFAGNWAILAEGQNLMVLVLDLPYGSERISGVLYRPAHMNLTGDTVTSVSLPVTEEKVVAADINSEGLLLEIQDDTGSVTKFQMILNGVDTADLKFADIPAPAFSLVRVNRNVTVATSWDAQHVYVLGDIRTDNPRMMQLFEADQADRKRTPPMDVAKLAAADAERRHLVDDMMRKGDLHTGLDFLDAAFIFQHGMQSNDFLVAHALALSALRLGRADAGWIAAATLDRYLVSKGQPQIYGTQFDSQGQAPLEPDLIPDALRHQMNVPALADQAPPPSRP